MLDEHLKKEFAEQAGSRATRGRAESCSLALDFLSSCRAWNRVSRISFLQDPAQKTSAQENRKPKRQLPEPRRQ